MTPDNFLDTNIIFHYSNYTDMSSEVIKKCYFFVKNKSGNFILCWAVLKELDEIVKKELDYIGQSLKKLEIHHTLSRTIL